MLLSFRSQENNKCGGISELSSSGSSSDEESSLARVEDDNTSKRLPILEAYHRTTKSSNAENLYSYAVPLNTCNVDVECVHKNAQILKPIMFLSSTYKRF